MHFVYETKTSLTACFCHGTYAFQSESTLYICLNVKSLLALISGRTSINTFPLINKSYPVNDYDVGSILISFVASCNILPIFSRNSFGLSRKISFFYKISHAELKNHLNIHGDLEVAVTIVEFIFESRFNLSWTLFLLI